MKRRLFAALLVLGLAVLPCAGLAQAGLTVERTMPLSYARNFSVDYCAGGYTLFTVQGGARFLTVPEGAAPPQGLDEDIFVLHQPLEGLLISSTPTMSLLHAIGALDAVGMTTTERDDWHIGAVRDAMDAGNIAYIGSYKAPDFETLAAEPPPFAVFSTMLSSVPDVAEKITELGIPYTLDQSTYEDHPLGRTEWVKLYGALLGKEAEAQAVYDAQAALVGGIDAQPTGKTAAIFYITSKGNLYARNGGDYVVKMLELAGGTYAFSTLNPGKTGTQQMEMEEFYAGAGDADYLIYIWNLGGKPQTLADFVALHEMLAEFKAVKEGNVWCTTPDFFQISDTLGEMILDMHRMLLSGDASGAEPGRLFRLQ